MPAKASFPVRYEGEMEMFCHTFDLRFFAEEF